ncbi:MAG: hypothetical protein WA782_07555 [Sulfitobacter sp.]
MITRKPKETIVCEDAVGERYELLLFQNIEIRRNAAGEEMRIDKPSARLKDNSAVVPTGPDTFRIIWSGVEIRRAGP